MPSPLFRILKVLLLVAAAQFATSAVHAADFYWEQQHYQRTGPSPGFLCGLLSGLPGTWAYTSPEQAQCYSNTGQLISNTNMIKRGSGCTSPKYWDSATGSCVTPSCPGDSTWNGSSCDLVCSAPAKPNPITMMCDSPPEQCAEGSSWDWDNNRCSYPQDDACGSVGAQWNPEQSQCVCPAGTVQTGNATAWRCADKADDQECTPASPDFSGYINGKPICAGRNRCPDGGKPGFVGVGDDVQAVCLGGDDPNCPEGQTGGFMNGQHVCVTDPDDGQDPRCALNETPGYVGSGADAQFTCVPKDYVPETCPAGQYVWNTGTGGFGCVTSSGQPPKTDSEGNAQAPGTVTGTITGGSTGTGEGGTGDGGETGEPGLSKIELDFSGLIENAPNDNYQKDLEEYGESKLEGIDVDSLVGEFDGPDGAFTDRAKLDTFSNFVLTNTIGTDVGCSGNVPFFGGLTIDCDRMNKAHRIWSWLIFVGTMIYIFKTLTRPSASGV